MKLRNRTVQDTAKPFAEIVDDYLKHPTDKTSLLASLDRVKLSDLDSLSKLHQHFEHLTENPQSETAKKVANVYIQLLEKNKPESNHGCNESSFCSASQTPLSPEPTGIQNNGQDCCFISCIQLLRWAVSKDLLSKIPTQFKDFVDPSVALESGSSIREAFNQYLEENDYLTFSKCGQEDPTEILHRLFAFMTDPVPCETTTQPPRSKNEPKTEPKLIEDDEPVSLTQHLVFSFLSIFFHLITFGIFYKSSKTASPSFGEPKTTRRPVKRVLTKTQLENKKFLQEHFGTLVSRITKDFSKLPHNVKQAIEHKIPLTTEELDLASMVSLELPETNKESLSLFEVFRSFTKKETITDPSELLQFEYENETYRVPFSKRIQYKTAPEQLMFSFKRFSYDTKSQQPSKISTPITMDTSFQAPARLFEDKKKANYDIKGFIQHIGDSPKYGHYVAFANIEGSWHRFNDGVVTVIEDDIENYLKNAYCIVANRTDS